MIKSIYIIILSAILLPACSEKQDTKTDKETIATMIKDEEGRENFSKAVSDSQIETLNALAASTEPPVSVRERTEVKEEQSTQVPVLPEKMIAGVEVRSALPDTYYNGAYIVEEVAAQSIRGKAGEADFTIYYKLPDVAAFNLDKGKQLSLDYNEATKDGSAHRRVVLSDKGDLVMLALEEGSLKPYETIIKDLRLSVSQGDEKQSGTVRITFNNERFSLKQGEKVLKQSGRHTYQFYLRSSYATNPDNVTTEGNPYFVKLYAYVVK